MYGYDYYDYGYSASGIAAVGFVGVIAAIIAFVLMILVLCLVTPAKKRDKLPGFFRVLHDIFNFNGLIIEVILKAAYIFATIYIILQSFFMIFIGSEPLYYLLSMILGPIAIRIVFELIMMAVLLVKNVITINNKLKYPDDKKNKKDDGFGFDYSKYYAEKKEEPAAVQEPAVMQTPVAESEPVKTVCSNCGNVIADDAVFCNKCGTNINR